MRPFHLPPPAMRLTWTGWWQSGNVIWNSVSSRISDKGNAVAFLKDVPANRKEEIISFVETSWDKCQAYTDNLKAFLGEDKDREIWIFSFRWTDLNVTFRPGKSSLITEITPQRGWKMIPLEFTANINDECFDDGTMNKSHWTSQAGIINYLNQ